MCLKLSPKFTMVVDGRGRKMGRSELHGDGKGPDGKIEGGKGGKARGREEGK